jgi:hypothetical protein
MIEVGEYEGDLLGRPEAGEEAEFVVVALRRAPIAVNGCN